MRSSRLALVCPLFGFLLIACSQDSDDPSQYITTQGKHPGRAVTMGAGGGPAIGGPAATAPRTRQTSTAQAPKPGKAAKKPENSKTTQPEGQSK